MYKKIVKLLGSNIFFWFVWIISILQSVYIALISRYPMAFDEAHHFEVIKIHAKQWGPLILKQPDGPVIYGPLVRDPSYLYHYLLSFPYRLFDALGLSDQTSILLLRFFSIAMFAVGILLFRKLLQKTKASNAAINSAILFFILIPTVPLLAGQLNYDNLQFPLMALASLMAVSFGEKLQKKQFDVQNLILLLVVCILGTITKFTFLPVLTAVVIYLAVILARFYKNNPKKASRIVKKDWGTVSKLRRRVLIGILSVATGLFLWSYGVNLALYRNPVPPCDTVLGKARCSENEIWLRNYTASLNNKGVDPNPIPFTYSWLNNMHYRLFFTINGASGAKRYQNHTALGITSAAAVLAIVGGLLFIRFGKQILKNDPAFVAMVCIALFYIGSVWARNYNDYLNLGKMLAINGRYLQPLLLPIILVLIASYQWALRNYAGVKLGLLVVSLLLFLSGGGIIGFIHYSDVDWYFVNNQVLLCINDVVKKLIAPLFLWQS